MAAQSDASESPSGTASSGAPPRYAFIDALRGFAFLTVLLVHASIHAGGPAWLRRFANAGNYGVQLFFVASALTLLMSHESRAKRDREPTRAFFVRRLARIAPPFFLAAGIYLLHQGLGARADAPDGVAGWQILATLLFVHGWHASTINLVVPGGWSIAVEMNFYLLLPWLASRLRTARQVLVALLVTIPASIVLSRLVKTVLADGPFAARAETFAYYWLPRQAPVFLVGFLLYFAMKAFGARPSDDPLRRRLEARAPFLVVATSAGLLALASVNDRVPLAYLVFSVGFAILAFALSLAPLPFLVNRVTRYVGKVSYSAYLTHFLVLDLLTPPLGRVADALFWPTDSVARLALLFPTAAIATTLLSTATYQLLELPGQRLGERVIARLGWGTTPAPNLSPLPTPSVDSTHVG